MSCQKLNPEIVTKPAFTVVGIKYHGDNKNNEIKKMWDEQFFKRTPEIKNKVDQDVCYGVCFNFDPASGIFDYIAGYEVSSTNDMPADMASIDIKAQTYAVFACTLPEINETIDAIYSKWMPESDYECGCGADGAMFEYYDKDFCNGQKMYIYAPVIKKK